MYDQWVVWRIWWWYDFSLKNGDMILVYMILVSKVVSSEALDTEV